MRNVAKQIVWPVRGVEEVSAYHDAAPDTTRAYAAPFSLNVCPRGPIEQRDRGGSRPGLAAVAVGTSVRDFHPSVTIPQTITAGNAPSSPTVTAKYRDRIFASLGSEWYCSRMGKHGDWDYGADTGDTTRAVQGNLAFAGDMGEAITAIMPVDDGTLYIATAHTLWRLQGDPAVGQLHLVSREYGVVGAKAWCTANQRLFFVSHRGFVSLTYGEMPRYDSDALPKFPVKSDTILGFDATENCVFAVITTGATTFDVWQIEAGMGTINPPFWPLTLPSKPTAIGTANGRVAFYMGSAWKQFDDSVACEAASRIAIGPFRISASDDSDGFLAEMHVALAEQSSNVTATVYAAHAAERAVKRAKAGTGGVSLAFAAGWNPTWRPRVRGAWCVLVLECAANGKWAFEAARAVCRQTGRLRP